MTAIAHESSTLADPVPESAPVLTPDGPFVAYFSMEIALESAMPTYAGGLGVLAGDTLRAAADHGIAFVAVTLLHRHGYFQQHLDQQGWQSESPAEWSPRDYLTELPNRVTIQIEGRPVALRAWRYVISGIDGGRVAVHLLDANLPENHPDDQLITDRLYSGDARHRLRQEAVLGMGGVKMLRSLGYQDIATFHMNEGHSSLLCVELLREQLHGRPIPDCSDADLAWVRSHCVFTTHTPIGAGHDQFHLDLVREVLGEETATGLRSIGAAQDDMLNMTRLGLVGSRYINGVAMRHGEVSRGMFPGYPISSITNGVDATRWTTEPFQALFDRWIPSWRRSNIGLRNISAVPSHEVRSAHEEAKQACLDEVFRRSGRRLSPTALTIGFARRATPYKRNDLLFTDLDRLRQIVRSAGPLQVIFSGKAHPHDEMGNWMIRRIVEASSTLGEDLPVVYLEDYSMEIARTICGGVDLWLNNPEPPLEASGTSGMKAALNGVPSLSVLDGWWEEGHVEGVTGWSIGESGEGPPDTQDHATALYDKLEHVIMPLYYGNPGAFDQVMRSAIALNGSFFNAQRMLTQYIESAYRT